MGGNSSVPNSMRVGCRSMSARAALRLATQFGDARRDVDMQVGVGGEHPVDPRQILRGAGDVRADERGPRMAGHQPFERRQQRRRTAGIAPVAEPPLGMLAAAPPVARSARPSVRRRPTGSPVWIVTGRPASAAASQTGASRSSSGASRLATSSAMCSPRSFQTLRPRHRSPAARRTWAASRSPNPASRRHLCQSSCANVANRPGCAWS